MQTELKRIQREVGITFVYVTHDQEEALTMSDRLAVMSDGRIEQVGPPVEVYERPATEFVASFVGVSNLIERGGRRFTVRPEKVRMLADGEAAPGDLHVESGTVSEVVYLGMMTRYRIDLDAGGSLIAVRQNLETAPNPTPSHHSIRVGWRQDQTYDIGASGAPRTIERDGGEA